MSRGLGSDFDCKRVGQHSPCDRCSLQRKCRSGKFDHLGIVEQSHKSVGIDLSNIFLRPSVWCISLLEMDLVGIRVGKHNDERDFQWCKQLIRRTCQLYRHLSRCKTACHKICQLDSHHFQYS